MSLERVVLIGFMAAGKTEVGELLARDLGWIHIDLDREIEARTGRSVADVFEAEGEVGFRAHEVAVTPAIAARRRIVVSTGGGWVTNPGLLAGLPPDSLTVYLRVSPAEVRRRLAATAGQPVRPLLLSGDPDARIAELLAAREPLYRRADVIVETDGRAPREVSDLLLQVVRERLAPPPDGAKPESGNRTA